MLCRGARAARAADAGHRFVTAAQPKNLQLSGLRWRTLTLYKHEEDTMVDYGEHNIDEAPTNMHVRRAERRYGMHKLARAVGHLRFQRRGGESTKNK